MPRLKALFLLSLATLLAPALMLGQSANPAVPGTLNYVEGQVSINGQIVNELSAGSTQLHEGQVVATGNGRAEILLTPGVFLRLGDNSAASMVSPDLARTEVELLKGRADVEVDQLFKQNDLLVKIQGDETRLLKTGLYAFNFESGTVRVFDGEASVLPVNGQQKPVVVKKGHELAVNGDREKPTDFDEKTSEDALYNWSSLRSQYLGEANVQLASAYEGAPAFAPGWFWDAGLYGYTWLPGYGAFFNPFGYGFYSPYYLYGGGFVYGYGRGYGRGVTRRTDTDMDRPASTVRSPADPMAVPSKVVSGGFHGGGGGGGFHGGGGGGGRR